MKWLVNLLPVVMKNFWEDQGNFFSTEKMNSETNAIKDFYVNGMVNWLKFWTNLTVDMATYFVIL